MTELLAWLSVPGNQEFVMKTLLILVGLPLVGFILYQFIKAE